MPEHIGNAYVASFTSAFHGTSDIDHGVRLTCIDSNFTQQDHADLTPDQAELLAAHLLWRAALVRYIAGEPLAARPHGRYTKQLGDIIALTLVRAKRAVPLTKRRRPDAS